MRIARKVIMMKARLFVGLVCLSQAAASSLMSTKGVPVNIEWVAADNSMDGNEYKADVQTNDELGTLPGGDTLVIQQARIDTSTLPECGTENWATRGLCWSRPRGVR